MTETLKTIASELAEANKDLQEKSAAVMNASEKRDALAAEIASLDAALESAEAAHARAMADVDLGGEADTKGAAKALEGARRAHAGKQELVQQHRIACAVVEELERRYQEAIPYAQSLSEQYRQAVIEELWRRADATMDEARNLLASFSAKGCELEAIRSLLAEVGASWNRGTVDIHQEMLTPSATAVMAHKQAISAELNAI